jgi:hypothetical protein
MAMYVTIVLSKICYGPTRSALNAYIARDPALVAARKTPNKRSVVQMSDGQFVRFKNAGRQHPSMTPGKSAGAVTRDRAERRGANLPLQKWDVGPYRTLTGRTGPWGDGSMTNRDHITADSSNQVRWGTIGNWPMPAASAAEVRLGATAVVVSGRHHRSASYTYGGRTKLPSPVGGFNRTQFGAHYPTDAVMTEVSEMLEWKADRTKHTRTNAAGHVTLRVEAVGAYAFLYKTLVADNVIHASDGMDETILHYLNIAVRHDDGVSRF